MKGHLQNLFDELPAVLDKKLAKEVKALLDVDLGKDMKTGGDYRLTAIHLLTLLRKRKSPPKVLLLLETIVEISELLYADDSKRSPKTVLRLYNSTWLHFELCCDLFQSTTTISHQKMFGIYLHALLVHGPPQYEIMSLKSANSEHEERLFGQAKNMVHTATNRKPTTVIPNILLRLQAKQKRGDMYKAYNDTSSRVSKEAKAMGVTTHNTTIPGSFLSGRMSSWQAHLERISTFLLRGKGTWWTSSGDAYEFLDGSEEIESRPEGPTLHHFRDTALKEVYQEKKSVWQLIIEEEVVLPTPFIKLYDTDGNCVGRRSFEEQTETDLESSQHSAEEMTTAQQHSPVYEEEMEEGESHVPEVEECMVEIVYMDTSAEQEMGDDQTDSRLGQHNLQTKLCKAISKALGEEPVSEYLLSLDKIRHQIKHQGTCVTPQLLSEHKQLIRYSKQQLQTRNDQLKQAIKEFEHTFYMSHRHLPDPTDENEYRELTKSQRFVTKLLKSHELV